MITVEQAREGLKKAIEEKGADYVYVTNDDGFCVYNEDGCPSCIVGHAINYIDPELFKELSAEEAAHLSEGGGLNVGMIESIPISKVARDALQAAQNRQDTGGPWGEALAMFEATVAAYNL